MLASISSKTSTLTWSLSARIVLTASMIREISPPLAILRSGSVSWPGLVRTRKSNSSRPEESTRGSSVGGVADLGVEGRLVHFQVAKLAFDERLELAGGLAAEAGQPPAGLAQLTLEGGDLLDPSPPSACESPSRASTFCPICRRCGEHRLDGVGRGLRRPGVLMDQPVQHVQAVLQFLELAGVGLQAVLVPRQSLGHVLKGFRGLIQLPGQGGQGRVQAEEFLERVAQRASRSMTASSPSARAWSTWLDWPFRRATFLSTRTASWQRRTRRGSGGRR